MQKKVKRFLVGRKTTQSAIHALIAAFIEFDIDLVVKAEIDASTKSRAYFLERTGHPAEADCLRENAPLVISGVTFTVHD